MCWTRLRTLSLFKHRRYRQKCKGGSKRLTTDAEQSTQNKTNSSAKTTRSQNSTSKMCINWKLPLQNLPYALSHGRCRRRPPFWCQGLTPPVLTSEQRYQLLQTSKLDHAPLPDPNETPKKERTQRNESTQLSLLPTVQVQRRDTVTTKAKFRVVSESRTDVAYLHRIVRKRG